MMKNAKAGFTLAEVLTTLMVIGVVAAMTIPTLINSTSDAQYKAAYKKAMSVLGQGAQLLIAKDEECEVYDDITLAKCFHDNVISGSRGTIASDKISVGEGNVIITSDGMAYAFYYHNTATGTGTDAVADPGSGTMRSLSSICGGGSKFGTDTNSYNGADANCLVVVDFNGTAKGSKTFASSIAKGSALTKAALKGDDQAVLMLTGEGVRPLYTSTEADAIINNGYKYIHGSDASPFASATATN